MPRTVSYTDTDAHMHLHTPKKKGGEEGGMALFLLLCISEEIEVEFIIY